LFTLNNPGPNICRP